ncbi:MAG: ribulose-phosphate 3-epimerase [Ruminococcaceae bacterium]|nr:ribulose-phosphate 3-epimerase [Oscillospiraceae bacterium]
MSVKISPSLLAADFMGLKDELKKLKECKTDMLHFDIMDGVFVPNISFANPILKQVKANTDIPLDVHLMIDRPHRYIKEFAKSADYLGFHYEAGSDVAETLKEIRDCGCKACLTIKPCTKAEEIFPFLPLCDMVLVMSVEPGFGGQSFMPDSLDKVRALRKEIDSKGYNTLIEIDGGINGETAPLAIEAGVDVLVAGSYLFGDKMAERIEYLRSL